MQGETRLLKIFTMNCWGIPLVSKNRHERITALADHLATCDYDFVCLQELWSEYDYHFIKGKTVDSLPYSHYFHSGVLGSGLCVLSRFPIEDVFFHQWPMNGYMHKLQHGDWFGGKGIGVCRIQLEDVYVNVYTAHLHAEYNPSNDEYLAHRVLQALDAAQFVRLTAAGSDVAILGGDLNALPGDLAQRIICLYAELEDSCCVAHPMETHKNFGTNETAANSYTGKKVAREQPEGKRIDYIMFRTSSRVKVERVQYKHPLPNRVPQHSFSYSDHDAVLATLELSVMSPEAQPQIGKCIRLEYCIYPSIRRCPLPVFEPNCFWLLSFNFLMNENPEVINCSRTFLISSSFTKRRHRSIDLVPNKIRNEILSVNLPGVQLGKNSDVSRRLLLLLVQACKNRFCIPDNQVCRLRRYAKDLVKSSSSGWSCYSGFSIYKFDYKPTLKIIFDKTVKSVLYLLSIGLTGCLHMLSIEKYCVNNEPKPDPIPALTEGVAVCGSALRQLRRSRRIYWVFSVLFFVIIVCATVFDAPEAYDKILDVVIAVASILFCFTLFMCSLWNPIEVNAIRAGKLAMEVTLAAAELRLAGFVAQMEAAGAEHRERSQNSKQTGQSLTSEVDEGESSMTNQSDVLSNRISRQSKCLLLSESKKDTDMGSRQLLLSESMDIVENHTGQPLLQETRHNSQGEHRQSVLIPNFSFLHKCWFRADSKS
ncbi:uncharacterized protein LOC126413006 [Schistocerca serialis cubense]|uniref:uncharacterized protein LOC126413006 n=1 Tax=Schistocerca serialis cubense TaxID=2023355 RepID=UPI00214E3C9A|nr:uncharacterized protein LOC126413006 [Schistocerca serialis cubense]